MKHWLISFLTVLSFAAYSQSTVTIAFLDKSILIDGEIDAGWAEAKPISTFYQLEPNKGNTSTRKTIVKTAQFEDRLYFLFICSINSTNEIAAKIQQRDQLNMNDDLVSVLLDSYDDNRNAFLFQVNPL